MYGLQLKNCKALHEQPSDLLPVFRIVTVYG